MTLVVTSPPEFAITSPPDLFELAPSARSLGRMNKTNTKFILLLNPGCKYVSYNYTCAKAL